MKFIFLLTFCLSVFSGLAQKQAPYPSSDSITLTGLVNKPVSVPLSVLSTMADTTFNVLKINNHVGEYKFTYQQAKAVLLKTFLQKNISSALKTKEMLSLYFVCKAMDGFTVVYSYNELFNAATNSVYILTAYDNVTIASMPERPILLIKSEKSARLFMRGLKSIDVLQAK